MSNFTTASTLLAVLVLAGALAIALVMWRASSQLGDRRIRFIALGFGILAAKSAVSIYTIQSQAWHHEVAEMVGTVFDVAMVLCMAAPFLLRE